MSNILIISPHPDDETLGCGGMIFKYREYKRKIYWLIMTEMKKNQYNLKQINQRKKIISAVYKQYQFQDIFQLKYPTGMLDKINISEIIDAIKSIISKISANIVYIPFHDDIHTDHKITFNASISATKNFRQKSIKNIYMYETLSETNYSPIDSFKPNVFINITDYFQKKIDILNLYQTELKEHPFPRSLKSIEALAVLRGSQSAYKYAEAFQLIKEMID